MRIAWRWVLPIVPLFLFAVAGYKDYSRDRGDAWMRQFRAQRGETFGCFDLWASRAAYEDVVHGEYWEYRDCRLDAPPQYAALLNLPGFIAGGYSSLFLLKKFDLPMAPTFYGITSASSFAFWYAIGAWIERFRNSRKRGSEPLT